MAILGYIGNLMCIVAWIWIAVIAFKDSIGWGIGSLLCGIVGLIYGLTHMDTCKQPLLIWGIGFVLGLVGGLMGGSFNPQPAG